MKWDMHIDEVPGNAGDLKWSSHNKKPAIQSLTWLNHIYVTWKSPH